MLKKIAVALVIQLIIAGIIIASPTITDYVLENFGTEYDCKVTNISYFWDEYNKDIIQLSAEFDFSDVEITRYDYRRSAFYNKYEGYISLYDNSGTLSLNLPIDDAEKFYSQFPDDNSNIEKEDIEYYYDEKYGFRIFIDDANHDSKLEFDGSPADVTVVIGVFLDRIEFNGLYVDGEKITQIKPKNP